MQSVSFIPSGNFGNILAGYFAKRMGLPISKLIIATNENDILQRFWQTGAYEKQGYLIEDGAKAHPEGVNETLSPAMDILVSSTLSGYCGSLHLMSAPPMSGMVICRREEVQRAQRSKSGSTS